jgi:hypothetical protein
MALEGGCYCGELRYESDGEPIFRAQCHCRECQYISGGGANFVMGVPTGGFRYVKGAPKGFTRADLDAGVTREFCPTCGTHILTRLPSNPHMLVLKIGTLDHPSVYGGPQIAIWTDDKQPYHLIAEGVAQFPKFPG